MRLLPSLRALGLALALGAAAWGTGCSTIPGSTRDLARNFKDADYVALDPSVVRVRITSDSDDPLRPERTRLTVRALRRDGSAAAIQAGLVLLDEQDLNGDAAASPLARFGFGFRPEHVYVLGLDARSIRAFRKLQDFIRRRSIDTGNITLNYDFRKRQPSLVNVDLLLDPKKGYFRLFEKVPFPREENSTDANF